MKKIISYILLAGVALFATACEKDSLLSSHEGGVSFNIEMKSTSSTRTEASEGPVISPINVRIYRPKYADDHQYGALIRRYSAIEDIPNPLYLVAGKYRIKVEGGDKSRNKAFKEPTGGTEQENIIARQEKLTYSGQVDFDIYSHNTTEDIEVICTPINVKVNIVFDTSAEEDENGRLKTENSLFTNVKITAVPMTYVADGDNEVKVTAEKIRAAADKLEFDGTGTGYFIMPDDVSNIVYLFEGDHETDGHIEFIGHTSGVEGGKAYTLNFFYARTPDGSAGITLELDTKVDIIDDKFYFKPQPEMKASGGLNLASVNDYKQGDVVNLNCESINELVRLSLGDVDIFSNNEVVDNHNIPGLTIVKASNTKVNIKLTQEYFNSVGGSLQTLQFKMYDDQTEADAPYIQDVKFRKSGIMENSEQVYDLWGNSATIKAYIPDTAQSVQIKYRRSDIPSDNADYVYTIDATQDSDKIWSVDIEPRWKTPTLNGAKQTIYTPDTGMAIFAENAYTYDLYIDGTKVDSFTLTPRANQPIPYGDFENSNTNCFKDLSESGTVSADWGSGNNYYTEKAHLCRQGTFNGMGGNYCAYLQARTAGMTGVFELMAAGNLFTGDFKKPGMNGTVSFGMKYEWSARPTALKFKYRGEIGDVDETYHDHENTIAKKQQDQASILVAIVKWDSRHGVTSGTSKPEGMWSPDKGVNAVGEGEIVGYGLAYPTDETSGADSMTEYYVPIAYYKTDGDVAELNNANYSLVISFATSRYGDYMNGCTTSYMYVDDVEWYYGSLDGKTVFGNDTY